MKDAVRLEISFPASTPTEAGRLAHDLGDLMRASSQDVEVSTERASSEAMDAGSILTILLGAPAAVVLARGVADWIRKCGDPELVIKRGKEEIIVRSDLSPDQKFELVKTALTKQP